MNPAAGLGSDLDHLRALLEPHFELSVLATCPTRDADECARAALADAPDLVIAAGGDGTVSMVASSLIGTKTPLGIVPRGTANSIAAGLGIPTDDVGVLETLVGGEPVAVDTARANGRPMLLHASVGLHAATIAGTPRASKNRWGVLAYVKEGIAQLAELEQFDVTVETEREVVRCRAINVTAANVAPRKTLLAQGPSVVSPVDGVVDVTIVAASSLADVVAVGLHLLRTSASGEPVTRDNVGFLSATRVRITATPEQPVLIDGEPAGSGPLEIVSVPRSLLVVTPRDQRPARRDVEEEKLEGLPELEVRSRPR